MKRITFLFITLIVLILSACSVPNNTLTPKNTLEPAEPSVADTQTESVEITDTFSETVLETLAETTAETTAEYIDTTAEPETTEPETISVPLETEPETVEYAGMIALTFDDGPGPYTDRLLNILKENNAKATFFVVGRNASYRPTTIKRMYDEGHEIGNHTWNHSSLVKLEYHEAIDQLSLAKNTIESITGKECNLARAPYGALNSDVYAMGSELGISYIHWSLDTLDWSLRDAQLVYDETICRVKAGDIVLMHDIHESTIDAIEMIIPELVSQGYEFVTVSELLKETNDRLYPGAIYSKQ